MRLKKLTLTATWTCVPIADARVVRLRLTFGKLSLWLDLFASHVNDFTQGCLQLRVFDHFFLNWLQRLHKLVEDFVLISFLNLWHLKVPVQLNLFSHDRGISDLIVSPTRRPRPLYQLLKVIEANNNAGYIVESLLVYALIETAINGSTTPCMHCLRWLKVLRLQASLPDLVHDLLVVHLLKDTVTTNDDEIIIVLNLKCTNLGSCDHYVWVAPVTLVFRLNVANCARDGKSAGKNTMRSNECLSPWRIARRWIWYVWLILIDFASITLNSFSLWLVFWFMIYGKRHNLCPRINWHKSATVTDIGNVTNFAYNKHHNCTRTTSLNIACVDVTLAVGEL